MGRHKNCRIRDSKYFLYNRRDDTSTCQLFVEDPLQIKDFKCDEEELDEDRIEKQKCCKVLKGNKASNLKNHVQKCHPEAFKKYISSEAGHEESKPKRLKLLFDETEKSESDASVLHHACNDPRSPREKIMFHFPVISSPEKPKVAYVRKRELMESILRMVTVNSRPLTIVNDEWFRQFAAPYEKALELRINYPFVVDIIDEAYEELSTILKNVLKGRMFSLKADCVTRFDRSFIGTNAQFAYKGEMIIVTLGVIPLQESHTGIYLRNALLTELQRFDVSVQQIYTITTDNGSDLCCAARLVEDFSQPKDKSECQPEEISGWHNDFEEAEYGSSETYFSRLLDGPVDAITDASKLMNEIENVEWCGNSITNVRCAAHKLMLCMGDSLKIGNAETINKNCTIKKHLEAIDEGRQVVKALRKPTIANLRRKHGLKKPILDCPTRWNSTYDMMKLLYNDYRSFCDEYSGVNIELFLTPQSWTLIEEIVLCFQPIAKACIKLQKASITLTDIYTIYNVCQMELSDLGNAFSQEILNNLIKRREEIFENNEVFLAAKFLDPRYNFDLSEFERDTAINHLLWLHNKIEGRKRTVDAKNEFQDEDSHENSENESLPQSLNSDCSEVDPAEKRWACEAELRRQSKGLKSGPDALEFKVMCRTLHFVEKVKPNLNVLQFWEKKKRDHPELYEVAQIVFGVPGTQVTVERLFSLLNHLLSDRRYSLKASTIDKILFLKVNLDVLLKLKALYPKK